MEQSIPKVNISVEMGSKEEGAFLAKGRFSMATGKEQVHLLRNNIKFEHEVEGNFLLEVVLSCQAGRQEECVKYIQEGLDNKNKEDISPIQKLLERPTGQYGNQFSISIKPSKVILFYSFTQKYINQWYDQNLQFYEQQGCNLNFTTSLLLKGQQAHNNENRTTVKVDYCYYDLISQHIYGTQFYNAFLALAGNSEDKEMPPLKLISNCKKLHLEIKTHPYRQILNYFERAKSQKKEINHEDKNFPYIPPGLLQEKAQASLFFLDKMAMHLEVTYHSEEIFLRLIKVYMNFIEKTFNWGEDD